MVWYLCYNILKLRFVSTEWGWNTSNATNIHLWHNWRDIQFNAMQCNRSSPDSSWLRLFILLILIPCKLNYTYMTNANRNKFPRNNRALARAVRLAIEMQTLTQNYVLPTHSRQLIYHILNLNARRYRHGAVQYPYISTWLIRFLHYSLSSIGIFSRLCIKYARHTHTKHCKKSHWT